MSCMKLPYGCFCKLAVLLMGVLKIRVLLLGVSFRAADFGNSHIQA